MNLFTITDLTKEYGEGGAKVTALNQINLTIPEGKFAVILGASGSGKSTLLNMLGCMDKPTSGIINFFDTDITAFSKHKMTRFRSENIGFVFQSYNLLPDLTALENVEFSTELAGLSRKDAENALSIVGLSERMNHYPAELSGGEQQRVSIARAIAKNPKVLLCDEPTGALDFNTGIIVLEALKKVHHRQKSSVLLITHNQEIAKIADIVITLRNGGVQRINENPAPLSPSEVVW
ncbi:MAG: ABC transporter ATP-binding protein [Oscillospiraceae bacterium]|jgi:putative ABC transport system ATP-binding protein|nr:ABC transporter ATP-binding protein [Oscillospiraceae bacterium]